ncbi:unnamed protein product, partial [Hapterophycus canaliculatus]
MVDHLSIVSPQGRGPVLRLGRQTMLPNSRRPYLAGNILHVAFALFLGGRHSILSIFCEALPNSMGKTRGLGRFGATPLVSKCMVFSQSRPERFLALALVSPLLLGQRVVL